MFAKFGVKDQSTNFAEITWFCNWVALQVNNNRGDICCFGKFLLKFLKIDQGDISVKTIISKESLIFFTVSGMLLFQLLFKSIISTGNQCVKMLSVTYRQKLSKDVQKGL